MKKISTERKNPRVRVHIAAYLVREGSQKPIECLIQNFSRDGFGLLLAKGISLKEEGRWKLRWSPVPTLKPQDWSVTIVRNEKRSLGLALVKSEISALQKHLLERLVHYHRH